MESPIELQFGMLLKLEGISDELYIRVDNEAMIFETMYLNTFDKVAY